MLFCAVEKMTTDGGMAFTSQDMRMFLLDLGLEHHQTSLNQSHLNLRAEGSVKRCMEECKGLTAT